MHVCAHPRAAGGVLTQHAVDPVASEARINFTSVQVADQGAISSSRLVKAHGNGDEGFGDNVKTLGYCKTLVDYVYWNLLHSVQRSG